MWHASAASRRINLSVSTLELAAREALFGVGDPDLEWTEWTGRAFHLRRRLTVEEASKVGPVIDVRGTREAERRLNPVRHLLPAGWEET